MSIFHDQFQTAIQLRFDLMMHQIFLKHGVETNEFIEEISTNEAYILGLSYPFSQSICDYLGGTPLQAAYFSGNRQLESFDEDCPIYGSTGEFEALTVEQQNQVWEEFHSRCQAGDADEMYFYKVLMSKWLVGYVGH
ncbi:hypothetical protein [Flavobacterium sp.]|uniref:hypothetical protein n=1 Tax=Flavobacterium sp. TaxID=239 RepID=UPI0026202033|nr:hypothetical protein [Flavobacterium sp.]